MTLRETFRNAAAAVAEAPIVARVLGAIGLLAVLVATAFAIVLLAMSDLRGSTNEQVRANKVATATLGVERVVDELEQSLRSFILTRNPNIRAGWDLAQADLRPAVSALDQNVAGQPAQAALASSVVEQIRSYVSDYGNPLVQIAIESPAAANSDTASREGLTRIGGIRRGLSRLLAEEDALVSARAASARNGANHAVEIGAVALAFSGLLLMLVTGYLVRAVARPVRTVASGATHIAAGDLSVRIPPGGPAEIRELTGAFNSMAESVEQSRRALEIQNEQLRQSERAKSELITVVAHELRTPLASILGYTSLILRREPEAGTLERYVRIIHDQGQRLAGIVEGFLSAEEQNGGLALESGPVDLAGLLRKEVEALAAQTNEHEVVVDAPGKGLVVRGDRERLAQVVVNLVANAIKYSPGGGPITVSARLHGDIVRVQVRDQGLGIPEEHQSRVFTKFFRGEAKESGIPGVGLGLAVAREIVEAHGGRIGFESIEDEGSTFWFELPVRQPAGALS